MSLPEELLQHACALINVHQSAIYDAALRRSVSASYYAVFHKINEDAAKLIAQTSLLKPTIASSDGSITVR